MALRIPQEDQEGLIAILGLGPEAVEELIASLSKAPPSLKANELTAILADRSPSIKSDQIKLIVNTIINLYGARAYFGYSVEEFVDQLYEAMRGGSTDKLRIFAENDTTKAVLQRILSVTPLGTAVKAQTVFREYERLYCDARILTDLRPVFGANASESPVGASVVHNLRIAYHEGNHLKEFFVALGDDDVQELLDVLERAKTKSESLLSVLKNAGITQLDF